MSAFLAQLGKSVAERWLALLVLPGLLWTSTGVAAYHLGQAQPLNLQPLSSWLDRVTSSAAAHRFSAIALSATVALLSSAAAGLAAGGLGMALRHLWTAPATRPPMTWMLALRRRRWSRLREAARRSIAKANDPNLHGAALARAEEKARHAQRRRLAGPPQGPQEVTRIAERFTASRTRAGDLYGLDLGLAWPRLWAVLPQELRDDLTAAQTSYEAAGRLAAWALMYFGLAGMCWPAALLGVGILTTAIVKAKGAAGVLADLVDTAVDLHLAELAEQLRVPVAGPLSSDVGKAVGIRLTRRSTMTNP